MFTPTPSSATPVARPSARESALDRTCPGARLGGGHGTVCTEPPSWSTAISSRGCLAAAAACWSVRAIDRTCADEEKFQLCTITPPISPRLARASSDADGVFPPIETTSFCPTSCGSVGPAPGRLDRGRGLTKHYGDKRAVDDLTFSVGRASSPASSAPTARQVDDDAHDPRPRRADRAATSRSTASPTATTPAPLHEVGALLEAKAVHRGRSRYNHLLALAQTHGIPQRRVDEVLDLVGLHDVASKRAGQFSLGMGQRLGIAAALLGDPQTLILDEPVNGLDPEGILWIRNLLKGLAAEGRTVFVSSHLMSEMALTADHLIVIGRGRLIADMSVDDFIARRLGQGRARALARAPSGCAPRSTARASRSSSGDARRPRGARADGRPDRRRRRGARDRAARADAAAGVARGGVHDADPHDGRVRVSGDGETPEEAAA